jgi:hypothetical protein
VILEAMTPKWEIGTIHGERAKTPVDPLVTAGLPNTGQAENTATAIRLNPNPSGTASLNQPGQPGQLSQSGRGTIS